MEKGDNANRNYMVAGLGMSVKIYFRKVFLETKRDIS